MIEKQDIKLQFKASMNMAKYHHTVMRDDKLGIQCEQITKKDRSGYSKGNPDTSYFIDKDEREFKDIDLLIDAYNSLPTKN